jgi:RNase H-like domain found in reverse transcriptase
VHHCNTIRQVQYLVAPMGAKQSPDFAQEVMEDVLRGIEECDVYIDDIGCFDPSWDSHLKTLDKVLTRLQNDGFTINLLTVKCEWGIQETDWLGYWLTPIGLKPWKKKIDVILQIDTPCCVNDVRSFIGAVPYYRTTFPKHTHLLAPLTALIKKTDKSFQWLPVHQKAFEETKALIAADVLMRYPDHNLPFHVYTDASNKQLGAVIMQNGYPVAYYSSKLNSAQTNYTTTEKELLSVVETLKKFHTMLYGCCELNIYTDHKNLTFKTLNSQRVLCWRLFLEEYHPIFHYVEGQDNIVADALSYLPCSETAVATEQASSPAEHLLCHKLHSELVQDVEPLAPSSADPSFFNASESPCAFSVATDNEQLLECFVNYPAVVGTPLPLSYQAIATAQAQDAELQQRQMLMSCVKFLLHTPGKLHSYSTFK